MFNISMSNVNPTMPDDYNSQVSALTAKVFARPLLSEQVLYVKPTSYVIENF